MCGHFTVLANYTNYNSYSHLFTMHVRARAATATIHSNCAPQTVEFSLFSCLAFFVCQSCLYLVVGRRMSDALSEWLTDVSVCFFLNWCKWCERIAWLGTRCEINYMYGSRGDKSHVYKAVNSSTCIVYFKSERPNVREFIYSPLCSFHFIRVYLTIVGIVGGSLFIYFFNRFQF